MGKDAVKRLSDGIPVKISLRDVKMLRISVRPDGSVEVTAPRQVGLRAALSFANERLGWIEARRSEALARCASRPQLLPGETAPLWGERMPVSLGTGRTGARLDGGEIVLTVPEGADYARRRAALLTLYRSELEREIPPLVEKYAAALDVAAPVWSLRDMRTRFGSCTPARGTVRFALMLAERPPLCLEYVVAHELAHLRIHGHGPDFHALLSSVFPREREARALLKA